MVAQPIQFQQRMLLHVYVKNVYFNKEIIFENQKSQSIATIHHLQKYIFLQKTRAECQ